WLRLPTQVEVDRFGGLVAVGDAGDQVAGAGREVATGEEARHSGHPGSRVDDRPAVPRLADTELVRDETRIRVLAGGGDDRVDLEDEFGALDRDWPAPAGSVRLTEDVADALEAGDVAVGIADRLERRH